MSHQGEQLEFLLDTDKEKDAKIYRGIGRARNILGASAVALAAGGVYEASSGNIITAVNIGVLTGAAVTGVIGVEHWRRKGEWKHKQVGEIGDQPDIELKPD